MASHDILVWFDTAGHVIGSAAGIIPVMDQAFWSAQRWLADETFGLAWLPNRLSATSVRFAHYSMDGTRQSPIADVAAVMPPTTFNRVALADLDDGVLAAWLVQPTPQDQISQIYVATMDTSGTVRTPVRPLDGVTAYRDAGLSLLTVGNDVMLSWVDAGADTTGHVTRLLVAPLGHDGAPRTQPVEVVAQPFLRHPSLARTALGVAVVFESEQLPEPTSISAALLTCTP
jgi:hypothetical protein